MPKFSTYSAPLTALTRKGAPFNRGPEQEEGFNYLKTVLIEAPFLAFSRLDLQFIVATDASFKDLGCILS